MTFFGTFVLMLCQSLLFCCLRGNPHTVEIMEAFGRKNKPVLTALTDLVAVLTVLTVLFFQI